MKQQFIYLFLICSFFMIACTKKDTISQKKSISLTESSKKTFGIDTTKAKQEFLILSGLLKKGEISFDEYRVSVKSIFEPFKEKLNYIKKKQKGFKSQYK